jgi:hypothetical protein
MLSCVLVNIVPVSSEQSVGADQEQVFEEEPRCLSKEGKWSSPLHILFLSHTTCMITKFTFNVVLHKFDGKITFLRT